MNLQPSKLTFDRADAQRRGWAKYLHSWMACGCEPPHRFWVRALIAANGVRQYKIYCARCDHAVGGAIAHDMLDPLTREYADRAEFSRGYKMPPCERCGDETSGVEVHHWAPWAAFGEEASDWPIGYLCRKCHQRWHTVMNIHARGSA